MKQFKIKNTIKLNSFDFAGHHFTQEWSEPISEPIPYSSVLVSRPYEEEIKRIADKVKSTELYKEVFKNTESNKKKKTEKKDTNTIVVEEAKEEDLIEENGSDEKEVEKDAE